MTVTYHKFPTVLGVDLMEPYTLLVSVTGRLLFLSILLELSTGYGTTFLKGRGYHTYRDTNMSSKPSTGYLRINMACPPQDSNQGHQRPQTTSI